MENPVTTPSKQTPSRRKTDSQPPTTTGEDMTEQDQRDMTANDPQSTDEERGHPDRVEIGDPIPEDNRTIRSTRGSGETGEDEDLPGTARDNETGEDEDMPDGDTRH